MLSPTAATTPKSPKSYASPNTPPASQKGQYPFPQHDSAHKSGRSSRHIPRRESTASIASSIGGTLDTASQAGNTSMNELSHNAIYTLVSPPIVRTGLIPASQLALPPGHRPPTNKDIPPVSLTNIPHVDSSAFKPYLSQVGSLYETYQRAKAGNEDAAAHLNQRETPRSSYFPESPSWPKRSQSHSSTTPRRTSSTLTTPISPTLRTPTSSGAGSRRNQNIPTPLSTIPSVYFEDNFQLENPRTFDIVSERSDVIPQPPPREENKDANGAPKAPAQTGRKALHTNAILQEKLSWYMDTVEVHLINSIATASSSFFAALGSLKELQSEATESITKIKTIRSALKQLDEDMAVGGLEVVKLRQRRQNLQKLSQAVDQLCEVVEESSKCEEIVEAGNLEEADSRLDALEVLIVGGLPQAQSRGVPKQRIDLRRLKALNGVSEGIAQLRFRIGKGYEMRFIDALLSDLREHVESVPSQETLQRWVTTSSRARGNHARSSSLYPAYMKTNERLRPELVAALAGLNKLGATTRAATAYKDAIMREIKSLIRKHLPSSSDDDAESITSASTRGGRKLNQQEKSAILARNLRSLDAEGAEELLIKIYATVGEALRRLGVQVKVVLDVTSSFEPAHEPRSPKSPQAGERRIDVSIQDPSGQMRQIRDEVTQLLDLSSLLGQAVDVVQGQVTKVLKVRTDQTARLPLPQFLRYFALNRLFADECEAVSSRSGDALKEAVNSSIKEFLQHMADSERQRVIQALESDRWEAKDCSLEDQTVLARVLESMTTTPKVWTEYTNLWSDDDNALQQNGQKLMNGDTTVSSAEKTRTAFIEEQKFILTESTLAALRVIEKFEILMACIPSLTPDACSRLLEFLKTFNSRACQLILGAGATRSAGLRNITTKHLALASQACSFIAALLPYVREFVRRHIPSTAAANTVGEFDRVKRLFQDHQTSIHDKLVEIMSQRSDAHAKAMKKVNWDAEGSAQQHESAVSAYMESLTKETGTLHRVLTRHVAELDVMMVMNPIFTHYNAEWPKAFREAVVNTEAGKARMLNDVRYLEAKFSKIDESRDLVANLFTIVQDKTVQDTPKLARASTDSAQVATSTNNTSLAQVAQTASAVAVDNSAPAAVGNDTPTENGQSAQDEHPKDSNARSSMEIMGNSHTEVDDEAEAEKDPVAEQIQEEHDTTSLPLLESEEKAEVENGEVAPQVQTEDKEVENKAELEQPAQK